ncbi:MAG: TonB-dependent receptor [Gemmatimonadaceae bacterium]|nr:TonB-dependent receptor [Gemmatimonadaceae bacterium]
MVPIEEQSSLLHVETQWNGAARNDRVKFVLGGSYRRSLVDSRGTLVAAADDARNDWSGGAFGQVKFELRPGLSIVAAGRADGSDLYDAQFSPKLAMVYAPTPVQSLRASVGKGFQTPRMTNFFLHVPLGLPADLRALEGGLRTALGSALANVPSGTLFTQSGAVPALALGNPTLDVEHVTSYEVGFRREIARRVNLTLDGYYSVVRDFVSALLPYANPTFGRWTAPASVDASARGAVESAVVAALGQPRALRACRTPQAPRPLSTLRKRRSGDGTGVEVGVAVELSKAHPRGWELLVFRVHHRRRGAVGAR